MRRIRRQRPRFGFCDRRLGNQVCRGRSRQRRWDEEKVVERPPRERVGEASYSRSTRLGGLGLDAEGSHFRRRFGRQWKRGEQFLKSSVNNRTRGG